jgi:hypothetical protein
MNFLCPDCGSIAFKRNGFTRHGKQNHRCLDCGRQFSHEPQEFAEVPRIEIPNEIPHETLLMNMCTAILFCFSLP